MFFHRPLTGPYEHKRTPYMDKNVIRNTAKCFTGTRLHWGVSNYNFTLSFVEVITWTCEMRIGGVLIFFFFFWVEQNVCSSQMSMKSHRDIMKLSTRPLYMVFFESVWPRCEEIGHFIWWNFCTWSSIKWIGKTDFQLWSHLICHFTGIYHPFLLCFDCVSTNLRLDYFLNLYQPPRGWTLHSENCAV